MKEKMEMKKVNPHKRIIQILCRLKTIPLAVSIILCLSGERGGGIGDSAKNQSLVTNGENVKKPFIMMWRQAKKVCGNLGPASVS